MYYNCSSRVSCQSLPFYLIDSGHINLLQVGRWFDPCDSQGSVWQLASHHLFLWCLKDVCQFIPLMGVLFCWCIAYGMGIPAYIWLFSITIYELPNFICFLSVFIGEGVGSLHQAADTTFPTRVHSLDLRKVCKPTLWSGFYEFRINKFIYQISGSLTYHKGSRAHKVRKSWRLSQKVPVFSKQISDCLPL